MILYQSTLYYFSFDCYFVLLSDLLNIPFSKEWREVGGGGGGGGVRSGAPIGGGGGGGPPLFIIGGGGGGGGGLGTFSVN